jgi:hypothetical protein
MIKPQAQPSAAAVSAGVARRDVTPPVGIFNRMWGAAEHDRAEGVHRPITATVLALGDADTRLLLVSLDWCLIWDEAVFAMLQGPLVERVGGDAAHIILACTHTHSVGLMSYDRTEFPGGEMIEPYVRRVADALADAADEAIEQCQPCTITYATGQCGLASNRDLPDLNAQRYVTGWNPNGKADDTLLVARITRDADDTIIATLVNYACHPTTLAWQNRLLSPDYVGAMRQRVESEVGGLCLFVQGASGELAPRHQYVGDPAVADGHGDELGHAVLGTLMSMLPPRQMLGYDGVVESGAPLAVWTPKPFDPPRTLQARRVDVELGLKSIESVAQLQQQLDACDQPVQCERLRRRIQLAHRLAGKRTTRHPLTGWRIGDALLLAHGGEAYSDMQIELRTRFADRPVFVLNVAHLASGYLYPAALGDLDIYPVWQSPFDREALETLIDASVRLGEALIV